MEKKQTGSGSTIFILIFGLVIVALYFNKDRIMNYINPQEEVTEETTIITTNINTTSTKNSDPTTKVITYGRTTQKATTKSTTKKTTKTTTKTTTTKNTTRIENGNSIGYTYGVKVTTNLNTKVSKYDYSSFNGTTKTMLSEAKKEVTSKASGIKGMVKQVNDARTKKGVKTLNNTDKMNQAAMVRAIEMAWTGEKENYNHTRPNGKKGLTVMEDFDIDFTAAAENIAISRGGDMTTTELMNGWLESIGHYENFTREKYTKIGIGYYYLDGYTYYVALMCV